MSSHYQTLKDAELLLKKFGAPNKPAGGKYDMWPRYPRCWSLSMSQFAPDIKAVRLHRGQTVAGPVRARRQTTLGLAGSDGVEGLAIRRVMLTSSGRPSRRR